MQLLPVHTKKFHPPKDDLYAELKEHLDQFQSGDVVLISSKVVAISEGRCLPQEGTDKSAIVAEEADLIIDRPYWPSPITVAHHAFIGAAGVDESNGNGSLILLPEYPFMSAERICTFLRTHLCIEDIAVVITDSRSLPFRYGATGVAIGWWGMKPLLSHIGEEDLFGRPLQYERSNIVDGLAAAANVVMGEVAEQTPIVIARAVPKISFCASDTAADIMCPFHDDTFRVLYERFLSTEE